VVDLNSRSKLKEENNVNSQRLYNAVSVGDTVEVVLDKEQNGQVPLEILEQTAIMPLPGPSHAN
jgi:hypothetical protein